MQDVSPASEQRCPDSALQIASGGLDHRMIRVVKQFVNQVASGALPFLSGGQIPWPRHPFGDAHRAGGVPHRIQLHRLRSAAIAKQRFRYQGQSSGVSPRICSRNNPARIVLQARWPNRYSRSRVAAAPSSSVRRLDQASIQLAIAELDSGPRGGLHAHTGHVIVERADARMSSRVAYLQRCPDSPQRPSGRSRPPDDHVSSSNPVNQVAEAAVSSANKSFLAGDPAVSAKSELGAAGAGEGRAKRKSRGRGALACGWGRAMLAQYREAWCAPCRYSFVTLAEGGFQIHLAAYLLLVRVPAGIGVTLDLRRISASSRRWVGPVRHGRSPHRSQTGPSAKRLVVRLCQRNSAWGDCPMASTFGGMKTRCLGAECSSSRNSAFSFGKMRNFSRCSAIRQLLLLVNQADGAPKHVRQRSSSLYVARGHLLMPQN